ncbi:hypothetical protein PSN01_04121 [Micromonospora saelicesensis]|nr:hypothetical protein PSN01_04121 [Micromonospora saelicesensis]
MRSTSTRWSVCSPGSTRWRFWDDARWAPPRARCRPRTSAGRISPTGSTTWTCGGAADPARPGRCSPRWPGSWAPPRRSPAGRTRSPPPPTRCAVSSTVARSCSCWTTWTVPTRSGRCCRPPRAPAACCSPVVRRWSVWRVWSRTGSPNRARPRRWSCSRRRAGPRPPPGSVAPIRAPIRRYARSSTCAAGNRVPSARSVTAPLNTAGGTPTCWTRCAARCRRHRTSGSPSHRRPAWSPNGTSRTGCCPARPDGCTG